MKYLCSHFTSENSKINVRKLISHFRGKNEQNFFHQIFKKKKTISPEGMSDENFVYKFVLNIYIFYFRWDIQMKQKWKNVTETKFFI